jgi:hypothetical protein
MGTKLYKRWGFVKVDQINFHFTRVNPSQEWKSIVKELESEPVNIMWRPPFGRYKEGETVIPWEGKPRTSKL